MRVHKHIYAKHTLPSLEGQVCQKPGSAPRKERNMENTLEARDEGLTKSQPSLGQTNCCCSPTTPCTGRSTTARISIAGSMAICKGRIYFSQTSVPVKLDWPYGTSSRRRRPRALIHVESLNPAPTEVLLRQLSPLPPLPSSPLPGFFCLWAATFHALAHAQGGL